MFIIILSINQDIIGENCVGNNAGDLALTDKDKMKAWVEQYARLLNVEFEWPSSELPEAPRPVCMQPKSTRHSVRWCSMAAGLSGIIAEMLKAAGEEGVELVRKLVEAVFSSGMIPVDWEESFIQNLYKGEGESLDLGDYRGLKLTDQVRKLLEWVLILILNNNRQVPVQGKTPIGWVATH